ncbi:MAG: HAMP domain-containing histidine kinase, partial [Bifidobacterium aquikefiri]
MKIDSNKHQQNSHARSGARIKTQHMPPDRPIGFLSSLKGELSVLITISTAIAFIMAWFLLKVGLSGWIAMPLTLIVALGITYM